MGNGRGNDTTAIINSEQEDLVNSSSSELDDGDDDDDLSDINDGMQFNLCKTTSDITANNNGASLSLIDSGTDWNNESSAREYQSIQQQQQEQIKHFKKCRKSFILLVFIGITLLITSFSLFIIIPLYQKQLEIGRRGNNAYGSILFISPIITFLLVFLAQACSWIFKWKISIHKFPIQIEKLFLISFCCGVAGTLCTISSYKRVPCHLQDPLKGAALVYSLIFYFFFCKKVMGLQKIFSATTAVVGLFISVDYGLCDEFRCHGNDISQNSENYGSNGTAAAQTVTTGWQGRAFWTLLYVTGITLWTLHLSLLEGNLIMFSLTPSSPPPNNLLTTISRLVSNTDRTMENRPLERSSQQQQQQQQKYRPKPIHLVAWIHIITLLILLIFGLIDIVPGTGTVKSFSQHWIDTGNTFICHFGIEPPSTVVKENGPHKALEYLSNLTPGSVIYNQTVQKLRRDKRSLESRHLKNFHKRLGHHIYEIEHAPLYGKNHSLFAFKKYKQNSSSTQTPLISRLILNSDSDDTKVDCGHLSSYSWLLISIYLVFILCTFYFLDISESAVFTVAVITGALPYIGLFWSTYRLESLNGTASLIWAPSISGELICSLLGAPIVFLGLILLFRAHFSDQLRPFCQTRSSNPYTSLRDA